VEFKKIKIGFAESTLTEEEIKTLQLLTENSNYQLCSISQIQVDDYALERKDSQWSLRLVRPESEKDSVALSLNFDLSLDYKREIKKKEDLLYKSLGQPKSSLRVLDTTCGLAIDSVHFSKLGMEVVSLERNPVLFFLLTQAQSASQQEVIRKIKIINSEASRYLNSITSVGVENAGEVFDAVYFDPMYPEKKKKSAKPRKEMLLFRDFVGEDLDADQVFEQITTTEVPRIIVKRPIEASALPCPSPAYLKPIIYQGKMVRYDVYKRK